VAFGSAVSPPAFANAVGPVLPRAGIVRATWSTLAVSKTTVPAGQSIVFTGRLTTGPARAPLADHALRLEVGRGGDWKTVGTAWSGADGTVRFTVKPTRSGTYRLSYRGTVSLGASVSASRDVTVKAPARPATRPSSSSVPASAAAIGSNGRSGSATAQAFVEAARAQSGKPYLFGSAGPDAFDCSGLVQYVLAKFGVSVPHQAHAQMGYGKAVSAADAAPGDLIFFLDGGYAYHVGIYAGGHTMIDAPNSRSTVGLRTIWGSNVVFRRIF
jgi:cell wall-associated NlpC family hydrolase